MKTNSLISHLFLQVSPGGLPPRMMSESSCLVSSVAPRSHDRGVWQLCQVMRLPVPSVDGREVNGGF